MRMRTLAALPSAVISFADIREARPRVGTGRRTVAEKALKKRAVAHTSSLCETAAGLNPSPDHAALRRGVAGPDRTPRAIRPSRAPPAIAVVLGEPELSQWLATLGIEPIEAGCRRRTVDPRRYVERRTVAPLPQVAAKGWLAGQSGALLDATAVSLLGIPRHQLQDVSLSRSERSQNRRWRNPLATSLTAQPPLARTEVPACLLRCGLRETRG